MRKALPRLPVPAYRAGVQTSLWKFRELFLDLRDNAGPGWGAESVLPWLDAHPDVVAELHELGRPANHRVRVPSDGRHYTALEGLYALSRIVEVHIAAHQPINDDPALLSWTTGTPWWQGELPDASAWPALSTALGAVAVSESRFNPFFHEIVSVQRSDDPDEAPTLLAEHWPGAVVGGLMLIRAGVTVRAGANHCDDVVAARSCLYWAWWRRNRVVSDPSHGWGHNSQWGTDFRRDYIADGRLHYNVDADPARSRSDLPQHDKIELLRYRCSVRIDLGADQFPFHESYAEAAA
jgi:hypothetical protein